MFLQLPSDQSMSRAAMNLLPLLELRHRRRSETVVASKLIRSGFREIRSIILQNGCKENSRWQYTFTNRVFKECLLLLDALKEMTSEI